MKFRQASNHVYTNKTKEFIISQKLRSWNFWQTANLVPSKGKSAITYLFNDPEVLSSASDKAKLFAESFSGNSNLDYSGISIYLFSRINLKLHNISVTPKLIIRVITNLIYQRHLVLIIFQWWFYVNCEPELSYILAGLFKMCLKESCLPSCWKVLLVLPVFKNVGERCAAKNYRSVSLLSLVS